MGIHTRKDKTARTPTEGLQRTGDRTRDGNVLESARHNALRDAVSHVAELTGLETVVTRWVNRRDASNVLPASNTAATLSRSCERVAWLRRPCCFVTC